MKNSQRYRKLKKGQSVFVRSIGTYCGDAKVLKSRRMGSRVIVTVEYPSGKVEELDRRCLMAD